MLPKTTPDPKAQEDQSKIPGPVKDRPPKGTTEERPLDKLRNSNEADHQTTDADNKPKVKSSGP